jgi:Ca2+-binding RTX toxin-like protein
MIDDGPGADVVNAGADGDYLIYLPGAGPGADVISGGSGGDHLTDGVGDDVVRGGDGNDFLDLGPGTDELLGGPGTDWLSARSRFGSAAVVIDFTAGEAQSSFIGLDAIAEFERAFGTDHNDTLIGDSATNIFLAYAGADHIEGRDGNDYLYGGNGIDSVDGGSGTDECQAETVLNCED